MNSSAIDIGVYKTPFAFGKKNQKFYDLITKHGAKILSQNIFQGDDQTKSKFNIYVLQNLFGVKIKTNNRLLSGQLKSHIKKVFLLLDSGKSKQESITQLLKEECKKQ